MLLVFFHLWSCKSVGTEIVCLNRIEEVAFSFNGGKDSTVLLHLLRAGYFLHQAEQSDSNGDLTDCDFTFPIQTIYFESSSAFPEINSFTYETASTYGVLLDIICLDFKSGLEALLKANPIRAIFLGVCIGNPTAVGQEQFSPSSSGWPPFMRVNPILDWSYSYTSIGSMHDTVPNALLCIKNSDNSKEKFRAAYMLPDGRLERAGRAVCGRFPAVGNGLKSVDVNENGILTASVIAVGDELLILYFPVGSIAQIDSVADEVERQKSANDLVFIYGGVGPLHSDVTVSGIAKAFGAPDEEFEEYLRHL
ncbi:putative FAD synthase [Camellia lanceoleosa]|uniref:FAD synthase n=1 Tax=Camellia lanceoleosa TaxID=1840588 RepID=A0ACC0I0W3_9ERIC|nr:putative FAD synthase [Camellia lanceoleosa]